MNLTFGLSCGGSTGAQYTDAVYYVVKDTALGAILLLTGTQLHTMNHLQMRSTKDDDDEDAVRSLASKTGHLLSCFPSLL